MKYVTLDKDLAKKALQAKLVELKKQMETAASDRDAVVDAWRVEVVKFARAAIRPDGVLGNKEAFSKAVISVFNDGDWYACLDRIRPPKAPVPQARYHKQRIQRIERRLASIEVSKTLRMDEDKVQRYLNGEHV